MTVSVQLTEEQVRALIVALGYRARALGWLSPGAEEALQTAEVLAGALEAAGARSQETGNRNQESGGRALIPDP